jgi:phospholipid/cholesterol/gamma-HCH transport system substrate-binding protein
MAARGLLHRTAAKRREGLSPFRAGVIAMVIIVVATYFAFARANPFAQPYELNAVFNTVSNLKPEDEVRIAGVEVGTIKTVEPVAPGEDGTRVSMEIEKFGLPIHSDAELNVRPRIFLEGNEFLDVRPGSPSAPVLESGATIPVNQTSVPVQFGQVLSVLESDTREDLRTFFAEFALKAQKGGGARGFHDSIKYWEDAYRDTAITSDATLGTREGDLSRVLRGQGRTFEALSESPEDLQGLITNFNTTAAAFAREDDDLEAAIPALRDMLAVGRPALASLNDTLPGVRRFASEALPAARSSRATIPETFPFIRQLRLLFRPAELRGLVDDLKPTIPALTRLNRRADPMLQETRTMSRCSNQVLLPFARTPIPTGTPGPERADNPNADRRRIVAPGGLDFPYDPDSSGQPFAEQSPRSFVGLGGESRQSDANGKIIRVNFKLDNAATLFRPTSPATGGPFVNLGGVDEESRPAPPAPHGDHELGYRRPVFRPDFPCELSPPPDLRAASVTPQSGTPIPGLDLEQILEDLLGNEIPAGDPVAISNALNAVLQGLDDDQQLEFDENNQFQPEDEEGLTEEERQKAQRGGPRQGSKASADSAADESPSTREGEQRR